MILALSTADKVCVLYILNSDGEILAEKHWQPERRLAHDLLGEIEQILKSVVKNTTNLWQNLDGLVVFRGPGSFTGLRIGIATMNSLTYSLDIPIVATSGENWLDDGIKRLKNGENDKIALPEYGAPANITRPKK